MTSEAKFKIGKWVFSPAGNELSAGSKTVRMEDRASRVLEYLCQNAGSVVSKEDLIAHVWQGRYLSEQSVPVVISNLRKTLSGDGEKGPFIETIPKRGYRLTSATPVSAEQGLPGSKKGWLAMVAVVSVFLLGFFLLQGEESSARKPGVVLTLNDIQNATGDDTLMSQTIAMSEAGSHFLSQAQGILLVRHWWNVEADDPTGGIFERYGENAPIYHLSGTLIEEGGRLMVTLFLDNPRTDEVLWSEAYPVSENDFMDAHLANLGKVLAVLGIEEQLAPSGFEDQPGEAVTAYWLGLYFWHLGTEEMAKQADGLWRRALEISPDFMPAEAGRGALAARWPGAFPEKPSSEILTGKLDDASLLVQAGTIALYSDHDPKKAETLARKALAVSPNDYSAYALLAEVLVQGGRLKEGLKAIREAKLLAPFSTVYPEQETEFAEMLEKGD